VIILVHCTASTQNRGRKALPPGGSFTLRVQPSRCSVQTQPPTKCYVIVESESDPRIDVGQAKPEFNALHNQSPSELIPVLRNGGRVWSCSYGTDIPPELSGDPIVYEPHGESANLTHSDFTNIRLRREFQPQFVRVRFAARWCERISPPEILYGHRYGCIPGKWSSQMLASGADRDLSAAV
jgi:hypothetical protein